WALEELGIRPLLPRSDRAIVTLLLTFGVSLILRDIAQVVWGTETHAVAPPFTGIVSFAEVFVPTYRLFVFGMALIAIFATLVAGVPHAARRRPARDRGRSIDGRFLRDPDQVGVRLDLYLRLRPRGARRRLA